MPVPKPGPSEDQTTFMHRCMRWMQDNDPERQQSQMVAICMSQWRTKEQDDFRRADEARRHPR